jgi:hypothetical protein
MSTTRQVLLGLLLNRNQTKIELLLERGVFLL